MYMEEKVFSPKIKSLFLGKKVMFKSFEHTFISSEYKFISSEHRFKSTEHNFLVGVQMIFP